MKNNMAKLYCKNCEHIQEIPEEIYQYIEHNETVYCEWCDEPMVEIKQGKLINPLSHTMIDSMQENIKYYGVVKCFQKIDNIYRNAFIRFQVRQVYFDTLNKLKLTFEGYEK